MYVFGLAMNEIKFITKPQCSIHPMKYMSISFLIKLFNISYGVIWISSLQRIIAYIPNPVFLQILVCYHPCLILYLLICTMNFQKWILKNSIFDLKYSSGNVTSWSCKCPILQQWQNLLEKNFPYREEGIYYITFWKLSWDENCTLAGYIRRKIANSLSFTTYFTSFEVMQTSISLPLLHQQQQGIRHHKNTNFEVSHSKFILIFFDGQF